MKQRIIAQFTDDCGCSTTGGGERYPLTFSRCKLHAAAPALLEALEKLLPWALAFDPAEFGRVAKHHEHQTSIAGAQDAIKEAK